MGGFRSGRETGMFLCHSLQKSFFIIILSLKGTPCVLSSCSLFSYLDYFCLLVCFLYSNVEWKMFRLPTFFELQEISVMRFVVKKERNVVEMFAM